MHHILGLRVSLHNKIVFILNTGKYNYQDESSPPEDVEQFIEELSALMPEAVVKLSEAGRLDIFLLDFVRWETTQRLPLDNITLQLFSCRATQETGDILKMSTGLVIVSFGLTKAWRTKEI